MTDVNKPRNRGGRPRKQPAPTPPVNGLRPPETANAESVSASPRRRRASVGGHSLKLQAPSRAGYHRRWVNDEGNRIADAQELAYDYVTEAGTQTSSLGSRISRQVGTKASGEPLHAFLMETPDELYAEGLTEKEAHNREIDEAIVAGRDSTGQMSSSETYGRGSIQRDR